MSCNADSTWFRIALAAAGNREEALQEFEEGANIAEAHGLSYEQAILTLARAEVDAETGLRTGSEKVRAANETLAALGVINAKLEVLPLE